MHSRAAQVVRAAGHTRNVSLRSSFTTTARVVQQPGPSKISQEDLAALDNLTARTIKAAGKGRTWPGWKESSRASEDSLWRGTQRSKGVVSEDKERFMADSVESPAGGLYGAAEDTYVHPGSFIELRRNGIVTLAVLIRATVRDGKPTFVSLTASGEIYEHVVADVFWVIPNLMTPAEALQCGFSEVPDSPSEHAARVHALRHLRNLDRTVDAAQTVLGSKFASLYERVRNTDPTKWAELKTADAAAMLMPQGVKPKPVDVLAVHRLLMEDALHYICHPHVHRVSQTFLVWPREAIDTHELVSSWIREHDNSKVRSFIAKAKLLQRNAHDGTVACPPAIRDVAGLPTFSEDDKAIIRFLRYASFVMRKVQSDVFMASSTKILKQIGFFTRGVPITRVDIFEFLKSIGVVPPWENEIWTRPHMSILSKSPPAIISKETSSANAMVDLAPAKHQFYSSDIVEGLRHDFGDHPVYVIDDPNAKELDDGISVQRIPGVKNEFWLHVHIADPTRLLHPDHEISQFARDMASTAYFCHQTWPMLPDALTTTRFSLGAPLRADWPRGMPVETMTFSTRVNDAGDILETKVHLGLVRKIVVTSYDQVDHTLGPPYRDTYEPFPLASNPQPAQPVPPLSHKASDDLKLIEQLSAKLRRIRLKQPVLFFHNSSPSITIPAETKGGLPTRPFAPDGPAFFDGYPEVIYKVFGNEVGRGQMMVSECMVLAGRVASRVATELGVPMLRRTTPPPHVEPENQKEFERLLATRDSFGRVEMIDVLRCGILVNAASYTLEAAEHGLLGIPSGEGYVRATSPLRRYLDLVTHWQLKTGLLQAAGLPHPKLFTARQLQALAVEQGAREMEMQQAMTENQRFWAVNRIQRAIDARVPANRLRFSSVLVSRPELDQRTREYFVIVHIPKLGLQARVENVEKEGIEIGDNMYVQLRRTHMGPPTVFATRVSTRK